MDPVRSNLSESSAESEDQRLTADPRLRASIDLFNSAQWYEAHDGLEELWHETAGPSRPVLQGILQIAVAQLHLERGNLRGAAILMGEGLGRLRSAPDTALGLDLAALKTAAAAHLQHLQLQAQPAQDAGAGAAEPLPPLHLLQAASD